MIATTAGTERASLLGQALPSPTEDLRGCVLIACVRRQEEATGLYFGRGGRSREMLAEAAFKMSRLLLLLGRHERQKVADADGGDAVAAISAESDPSPSRWQRWRHYAQQVVGRWAYEACVAPANHSAADAAAPPSQRVASTGAGAVQPAVQAQICLAAARFSVELGQNRKAIFYLCELARVHSQAADWAACHSSLLQALPLLGLAVPHHALLSFALSPIDAVPGPAFCSKTHILAMDAGKILASAHSAAPATSRAQQAPCVHARQVGGLGFGAADVDEDGEIVGCFSGMRDGWHSYFDDALLSALIDSSLLMRQPMLAAAFALYGLRTLHRRLSPTRQQQLMATLQRLAPPPPQCVRVAGLALPWLVRVTPLPLNTEARPRRADVVASTCSPSIFIFSPDEARKQKAAATAAANEVVWVAGEKSAIELEIANHLDADMSVEARSRFERTQIPLVDDVSAPAGDRASDPAPGHAGHLASHCVVA
eukprot:Transcript_25161.p1 GENE.Transcript_25161~~Transcript_25161.p1  ORF type:complete len:501 (-),score=14.28 Transcript_25161:2198-3649(-)